MQGNVVNFSREEVNTINQALAHFKGKQNILQGSPGMQADSAQVRSLTAPPSTMTTSRFRASRAASPRSPSRSTTATALPSFADLETSIHRRTRLSFFLDWLATLEVLAASRTMRATYLVSDFVLCLIAVHSSHDLHKPSRHSKYNMRLDNRIWPQLTFGFHSSCDRRGQLGQCSSREAPRHSQQL
jgi:hypothetical protein